MKQSHVIDSWIAELGLSSRRPRRDRESVLAHGGPVLETSRPGAGAPPAPSAPARRPRYHVTPSPC
jgi:hypothetical protein